VMVPRAKVMGIGLRKVASVDAIDDMFDQLAAPGDDPQLDWKVRHRENADRMTGGGLQGTLDVLKGLHALSRVRPLPQKERELYDSARHLLVGEIAAAMNLPLHVAEDNLDYALWPPPGMKRKGKPLQPAALAVPASSVGVARAPARAADGEMEDEMDFGGDAEVEGDGEPKAVKVADEDESDIADASETKDLVRQRAMRVTAEEEDPEPLDQLAAEALEATHEAEAAGQSERLHAPPGTTRPQAKRGAGPSPAPKTPPKAAPPSAEPKRAEARPGGNGEGGAIARSLAAKALEVTAKVLAHAKPLPKAAGKAPASKAKPAAAKKAAKARPAARKAAPKKPAKKAAPKKPARKGKR